jgi:hypothetical protein
LAVAVGLRQIPVLAEKLLEELFLDVRRALVK